MQDNLGNVESSFGGMAFFFLWTFFIACYCGRRGLVGSFKGEFRVCLDLNCPLLSGVHKHGLKPNTRDLDDLSVINLKNYLC